MNRIKFTVLVEDSLSASKKISGLEAKHGLSILVETSKPNISILMDTGPFSSILLRNMKVMDVSLKNINAILLSHCHYDHTGGLLGTLKEMKRDIDYVKEHPSEYLVMVCQGFKNQTFEAWGITKDGIEFIGEI